MTRHRFLINGICSAILNNVSSRIRTNYSQSSSKMPHASVNGHQLHYFDSHALNQAPSSTLPIVMVHGLGSSQNYWMPVISQLASTYRCIALDSYGAGRSKSNGEKVTLEGLAEDVIGLMDSLSIQKAIIAGHSMGGTITCIIASQHPERVAGIVPVGPVNPGSVKPEMFNSRIETTLKGAFICELNDLAIAC